MPSRDLADCVRDLQDLWPQIIDRYMTAHPGRSLLLTCTYRSPAEQASLYQQGRTTSGPIVTQCDGMTVMSQHNYSPSRALDFCVLVAGKVSWSPIDYEAVGNIAEALGLEWGGSWPHFKDRPHLQVKS